MAGDIGIFIGGFVTGIVMVMLIFSVVEGWKR